MSIWGTLKQCFTYNDTIWKTRNLLRNIPQNFLIVLNLTWAWGAVYHFSSTAAAVCSSKLRNNLVTCPCFGNGTWATCALTSARLAPVTPFSINYRSTCTYAYFILQLQKAFPTMHIFQQVSRSPEAPKKTPAGTRYKMVVGFIEFDSEFDFMLLVQCSVFQSKTHGCQVSLTVVHITILCCILNRICGIDGLCTYINDHSWAYYTSGQHKVRISLKNTHRTTSLVSYCDLST